MKAADGRGLRTTVPSVAALEAIERFGDQMLRRGPDAGAILAAADAHPDCPLLQGYAAYWQLCQETRAGAAAARPYLARARLRCAEVEPRERAFIRAMVALADGAVGTASARLLELVRTWPRDTVAAYVGQLQFLNLGCPAEMLAMGDWTVAARPDDSFALGMQAFGLEQCRRLVEAERAGRLAVERDPGNPWAHHAVAHVLDTTGRIEEGVRWLAQLAKHWDAAGDSMYSHNWWHVALFLLDRGDPAGALSVFDRRIWVRDRAAAPQQIGAVAMLARLELRGVDVGPRWSAVADNLAATAGEQCLAFTDLHLVYGLARAGRWLEARRLQAAMAAEAARASAEQAQVWAEVAVPLAAGLVAHAAGAWADAARAMGAVLPRLQQIGGSHTQRDLFVQLHVDALARAGDTEAARGVVERRRQARPGVPAPFVPLPLRAVA